jgi:Cys-rich protein (TIGR01571 family)
MTHREWNSGLCDCAAAGWDVCCLSFVCPFVQMARNYTDLHVLHPNAGGPGAQYFPPEQRNTTSASCCAVPFLGCLLPEDCKIPYCVLNPCLGWGWNWEQRRLLRQASGIEGHDCTDCLIATFCIPCSIAQHAAQIAPVKATTTTTTTGAPFEVQPFLPISLSIPHHY